MVARVLRGESPASIPFYRVKTTKLIVNPAGAGKAGVHRAAGGRETGGLRRGRPQEGMKIEATREGGSAVLRLDGRLDREWAEQLSTVLESLLQDGVRRLTLDLSLLTYISSGGHPGPESLATRAGRPAGRDGAHLAAIDSARDVRHHGVGFGPARRWLPAPAPSTSASLPGSPGPQSPRAATTRPPPPHGTAA